MEYICQVWVENIAIKAKKYHLKNLMMMSPIEKLSFNIILQAIQVIVGDFVEVEFTETRKGKKVGTKKFIGEVCAVNNIANINHFLSCL